MADIMPVASVQTGSFCLGVQISWTATGKLRQLQVMTYVWGTQSWAGNWILVLILPGVDCEIPGWSLSLGS